MVLNVSQSRPVLGRSTFGQTKYMFLKPRHTKDRKIKRPTPLSVPVPESSCTDWTVVPKLPKKLLNSTRFYQKHLFIRRGNWREIFTRFLLYLLSLARLNVSRCVSHQPAGCCGLLLMDRLMVSICYCFIEFLCGLVMARSVCNQSRLFIFSPPPFFLFSFSLLHVHSADSVFVSFLSSLPSLNLSFSVGITYKRLWKNDMCRTDNVSFSPLTPLVTYQRKLTHLPEKRGGKNPCLKKIPTWNCSIHTHVSSFISNVGFLESAH